jgi:hypothetical protein
MNSPGSGCAPLASGADERSDRRNGHIQEPFSNRSLFVGTIGAVAVHAAALYLPFTPFALGLEPISLEAWLEIVGIAPASLSPSSSTSRACPLAAPGRCCCRYDLSVRGQARRRARGTAAATRAAASLLSRRREHAPQKRGTARIGHDGRAAERSDPSTPITTGPAVEMWVMPRSFPPSPGRQAPDHEGPPSLVPGKSGEQSDGER